MMEEGAVTKKIEQALTSPALSAAVFAGIVAVTPRIINTAQRLYFGYGDKHLKRIDAIQKAYVRHCSEEKNSLLSTLDSKADTLPLYFQMDPSSPTIPLFFTKGLVPNLNLSDLSMKIKQKELALEIEELIGFICEYQSARDEYIGEDIAENLGNLAKNVKKKIDGDNSYFYDPVNLFCEEFKRWLVNLSGADLDGETKKYVEARIKYLSTIYSDSKIFSEKSIQTPFLPTVNHLQVALEKKIKKYIELAISRRSARDLFQNFNIKLRSLLRTSAKFIFYVFKEGEWVPDNFILGQVAQPSLPKYKIATDDLACRLLQHLITKTYFSQACFPNSAPVGLSLPEKEMTYQFIDREGKSNFPITDSRITKYNWYNVEDNDSGQNKKLGILPVFRQNKKAMEEFLVLHGLVEKISAFYLICDMIYDLTGDMGNVLLYGYAANYALSVFDVFEKLIDQFEGVVESLFSSAKVVYQPYTKNAIKNKTKAWINWAENCYKITEEAYQEINKQIEHVRVMQSDIRGLIKKINHPAYSETVKHKMLLLANYAQSFASSHSKISTLKQEQSESTAVLAANSFSKLIASDINPDKAEIIPKPNNKLENQLENVRLFEEAVKFYGLEKIEEALTNFLKIIENGVQEVSVHEYCALCLMSVGNSEEALLHLEQALGLVSLEKDKNKYIEVLFQLALAKESLGYFDEAKNDFSEVIRHADASSDLVKAASAKLKIILGYQDENAKVLYSL